MDFTCGLVDKFRDLVLDLTWEQIHNLVCYHRNIEQFNEKLEELALKRSSLEHRIDEATNHREQIEEEVQRWLQNVDEISEKAEEIHEKCQEITECSITSCPNPWLRYKLSKRAKAMTEKVVEIYGKGNFIEVAYRVPPPPMLGLTTRVSNEGIGSRMQIKSQIMEALLNPSVHMVGLCGFGGVGKTTTAKEVGKDEAILKRFEKVIMATVSQEVNIGNIQDQVIEKLGMQLNERTEEIKAYLLREKLKKEKNMLLILDDLWEELDLGEVGIPFFDVENYGKHNEGCKILLTSRDKMLLLNYMECQKIIEVGVLSEDEAWELFKRNVEPSIDSSGPELISIATEIVKKCGGLPLAIVTAAKTLRNNDLNVWKDYLKRLNNHLTRNVTGIKQVDAILESSYSRLRSLENKHVFLLTAMMSHDPLIEDLLMCSLAIDVLEHIEDMDQAHARISTIISKLKSKNLLLDSYSSDRVTIHDVIREFALSVASNELQAFIVRNRSLKEWPDENKLEGCKGICFQESDISDLPEELHGPILEFFMLNSTKRDLTIPSMLFKSSNELKLLAFTNVQFSSLPSLICLQKLKALCLHSCLLNDITEVGSLKKLKILSLADSEIQQLPIELGELTSLQMLNLSYCFNLQVIPQKLLSRLKKLEVLHMTNSFNQWKVEESSEANENASLVELMDLPLSSLYVHIPDVSMLPENLFLKMNLKRYRIFIGKRWTWHGNYETSKILRVELESSIHFNHLKCGIRKLLEVVEDLHLYGSNGLENLIYNHDVRGFPCLRHLQIESNDDIKYIVSNSAHHGDAFPILESLEVKDVKALEKLCEGPNSIVFPQLHTLKMEKLPALTGDFNIKGRETNNASNQIFKSLFNDKTFKEELEVNDCITLETVFDLEDLNDYKEIESSSVVVPMKKLMLENLPKLKNVWSNHHKGNECNKIIKSLFNEAKLPMLEILKLSNLNSLIPLIWGDQLSHNSFSNLKTLFVANCGFVKLMPLHVMKSLYNLEVVNVEDCGKLEIVFDFDDFEEVMVVPLKRLSLQRLRKLKNVWSNNHQGNVSFSSLRSVRVLSCHSLTSIFPASMAKGMLCDLEELHIRSCGVDVIVAKDQVSESVTSTFKFPRLTSLQLFELQKLRNFYPQRHVLEWPHLQRLSIRNCDELEIFEKGVSSSSEILEEERPLMSKYPLLSHHDKAIGNLEVLRLDAKEVGMIGSGKFPMYLFLKVKRLYLDDREWKETTISYISLLKSFPCLEELELWGNFKEAFASAGDDVSALAPTSLKLTLANISRMKSLTPSLGSSPNLTHLNVRYCGGLTTLMTSSTARSLIHLTHLSIYQCWQLEEIITKHEGEDDEEREIIFSKLEFLKFDALQRLKKFCRHNYSFRFPLLDQFIINECPKFKRFSPGVNETPSLKSVQLWQDREKHHEIWDTNLNRTFYHQQFVVSRELVLDEDDAIIINNDQFPAECCPQVEVLGIEGFVEEWLTIPHKLLERFPNLNELHVENCSFEEIVPSHAPSSPSFYNLTQLKVSKCHQLVYLVTNSNAQSLVNLETLEIEDCGKMEEIVRNDTDEDEGGITFNGLRILKLSQLPRLKIKDDEKDLNIQDRAINAGRKNYPGSFFSNNKDDQLSHNSFKNLTTLIIERLHSIKSVPLHVLESLSHLEKLRVVACKKLKMVFGFEDLNDYHKEESTSVVVPLNLTHLEVKCCQGLTTLMMSSVARRLVHITHLSNFHCNQIEEIITKHEREDYEENEIFFNNMKFLELVHLPRLKRFCGYNYTLKLPLLEHVTINECPQLTMFCPGAIHAPWLQRVRVTEYEPHKDIWMTNFNNSIQHLFTFEEVISTNRSMALNAKNITMTVDVFPNVWNLYVESFTDEGVTFPYSALERFPQLNQLYVEHCSFQEIFPSQDEIIDCMEKIPPFKMLEIANLDKLKSIWKDDSHQLSLIHQNLIRLKVKSCCSLLKLAPSYASFKDLCWLFVCGCHELIHLVTTSTAKSLVSLRNLRINDCKNMEEIVMNETDEDLEGGITFNQLWNIELTDMPSLKMLSSHSHTFEFPQLEQIKIRGCPKMKMFCHGVLKTLKLSKVKIEEHEMEWKDGGDLNKTMEGLSSTKM